VPLTREERDFVTTGSSKLRLQPLRWRASSFMSIHTGGMDSNVLLKCHEYPCSTFIDDVIIEMAGDGLLCRIPSACCLLAFSFRSLDSSNATLLPITSQSSLPQRLLRVILSFDSLWPRSDGLTSLSLLVFRVTSHQKTQI